MADELKLFRLALTFLRDLSEKDPEALRCLGRVLARERGGKGKIYLEPIELRRATLGDMGVVVSGCSACAHTPVGKMCPGCGNDGLVPPKKKKKSNRKVRKEGANV
jgi:hypothetical protein